ncbi:hypothetical protein BDN70DRAFT_871972 [Pholiota conissans]|uniref:Uncharacterized protein n=1 Tax=Pholiota conissans TaxID=109636 RepID=A0A9P6CY84_9AGAR|nr:hypothetical protein BDN70DRAFT_871972 [Pholiota conissans]
MSSRIGNAQNYAKREIPKIAGSSGAFIAIVVILIVIIVVSCTAVVYLLRDDAVRNTQPHRQQYSRNTTRFGSLRKWFARITHSSRSGQRTDTSRNDMARSSLGQQQGWMHARSTSDWDLNPSGEGYSVRHDSPPPIIVSPSMRTTDRGSMDTPRSSNSASPRSSRYYAPTSDSLSVGRYDPHAVARGRSYESYQGVTIESQLALPAARHPESQAILTSDDSFTKLPNHDSTENLTIPNPFAAASAPPSIRTFNSSGSKFVEAL